MWKNGATHWGLVARTLHWGMVIFILVEVLVGFLMSRTFGNKDPFILGWHLWASNIHHTGGLLILALAILRASWRLAGPAPEPVSPTSHAAKAIARSTHWLLYALLILIPLSGWAALSSLADSPAYGRTILWFFGSNGFDTIIPRIVPPVPFQSDTLFRYGLFAKSHVWLLIAGAVLLTLHVLAALRHHFLLKDATLRRMLGR